jgi:hypothetical protein
MTVQGFPLDTYMNDSETAAGMQPGLSSNTR